MKKIIVVMFTILAMITLIGCENLNGNSTRLVYEKLSEKEERILNLTGNKVFLYEIKNIPKDMKYEISLEYELYKNGEKIKNEQIASISLDTRAGKSTNGTVGINIEEDVITSSIGIDGAYATWKYEVEENINEYSRSFLQNDVNLDIGSKVYICHASKGKNGEDRIISLGPIYDEETLKDIISYNEINIFIKLSLKEIKD